MNTKLVYRRLFRTAQKIVKYTRLELATDDAIDHWYYKSRREAMNSSFCSLCRLYGIDDVNLLRKMICTII